MMRVRAGEGTPLSGPFGVVAACSSRSIPPVTIYDLGGAILDAVKSMACKIQFLPSGAIARVSAGTSLLEAARSVGLPVASACGADGLCARCGMQILEGDAGRETPAEVEIKRSNRIDPQHRLACRIRVTGDLVATATYW